MSGKKVIMLATGNFLRYRLGVIDHAYPTIAKETFIFITDRCSYSTLLESDNCSSNYTFLLIEDLQKAFPISRKYERFICESDEAEYNRKLKTFYSPLTGVLYPYHITRLVLPYLIQNNIKNFLILDSDFNFVDNLELLDKVLNYLEPGEFHFPLFGPADSSAYSDFYFKYFAEKYKTLDFRFKQIQRWDGYSKGFHFRTLEDMELFFSLWNDAIELLLEHYDNFKNSLIEINRNMMLSSEWIIQTVVKLFEHNFNYKIKSSHSAFYSDKLGISIAFHISRPEEKLYYTYDVRRYSGYEKFLYEGVRTVADFLKYNKEELYNFYIYRIPNYFVPVITDAHVYFKLKKGIESVEVLV